MNGKNRADPAGPEFLDVFVAGKDRYPHIRIPSVVVTPKGVVLAFAEGRQGGDHSENDIILKRSGDDGRTWGELQTVAEDGANALNNPCAAVLADTGRVLLMYQRYQRGFDEGRAAPGHEGPHICRSFLVHSDDDGRTWSAPREITSSVKRPVRVTSIASGPGVGIELRRGRHAGRVLFPFNEGPRGDWRVYAAWSDDRGATWQYGDVAPEGDAGHGNEVQMVERADGSILLNCRSQGGANLRKTAISADGGATWSPLRDSPALIEPQCHGSLLRYSDPLDGRRNRILFANPAHPSQRVAMTVRLSYDEGAAWPVAKVIHAGPAAYSCLTVLPDGAIGLLYEGGREHPYERILFARFTLEWLTDGKDRAGPP